MTGGAKRVEPHRRRRGVERVENIVRYHQFSIHCPPVTGIA
jgi:hypothetical protein